MVTDSAQKTNNVIKLSIIIPTYNRAEQLHACLKALCRQTQPARDFEVIVVIDGSTDNTRDLLANLITPYALKIIWQDNSGQNVARNLGVTQAQGHYCLFIDDDIVADPGLVAAHLRLHQEHENVVGIGRIRLALPPDADTFTRFYGQRWQNHYAALSQGKTSPLWTDCYGGNMSLSRSAFLEAGGFAPDIRRSHDIEFAYRLERQGLSFVYTPDAIGCQDERKGMRELIEDAERSGAAWVTLCERHPPMLAKLLGTFLEAARCEVSLQRALLLLDVPVPVLAFIGPFLRKRKWAYRWYRFLHSYSYWRGVRRAIADPDTWHGLTHGTPILMYHAFGGPDESASRYVIPVRRFAMQMAWLKRRGYHVMSLEEYVGYRLEYRLPPARSVVITIDDGYAQTRSLAYPILRRYGFAATTFIVSLRVGTSNEWARHSELLGRPLLSWSDIKEMQRGGMQFGAHTRTHPSLTMLSPELVQEEVEGSRLDLERKLNCPVRLFAYPYGEYDTRIQTAVKDAGFWGSCCVDHGRNGAATPVHALRRIEVWGTDSLLRFMLAFW